MLLLIYSGCFQRNIRKYIYSKAEGIKMPVPNQRTIRIYKPISQGSGASYLKIDNNILKEAMYNLKGNEFKLYIYLMDNANKHDKVFYSTEFCQLCDISDATYRRAWEKLEKLGYIGRPFDNKETFYIFREKSNKVKTIDDKELKDKSMEELLKEAFEDDIEQK